MLGVLKIGDLSSFFSCLLLGKGTRKMLNFLKASLILVSIQIFVEWMF